MKKEIFFAVLIMFFLSSYKQKKDTDKVIYISKKQKKTPPTEKKPDSKIKTGEVNYKELTSNEMIVQQLHHMKKAIEDKDIKNLLQFFDFPVKLESPNMLFVPYHKLLERWPSKQIVTKKDFLELAELDNYKKEELYRLLTKLDLTVLKKTNSVEKEVRVKNDPCYYIYSINIEDNKVTLMYGSNTSKYAKSDEDWCPEHNDYIIFKIVGTRIVFDKYNVAG